jgi:transposase
VLPVAVNEELKYEMPRNGTTIRVKNKRGRRVYELVWAKDKFRLKRS